MEHALANTVKRSHFNTFKYRELNFGLICRTELPLFSQLSCNPFALNYKIIQAIGLAYLSKYSKPESKVKKFFSFHNNHSIAESLARYNEQSPQECWNFLTKQFSNLKKANGKLALTIIRTFELAYTYNFRIYETSPNCLINGTSIIAVDRILAQLTQTMNNFFEEKRLSLHLN